MKNNENSWVKQDTQMVDQREVRLPPTWSCTGNAVSQYAERGQRVHQSGRERFVANRLIQMLANAHEKVVVSSFLLADKPFEDALLAAAQRGVRVYILLAIENKLGAADSEEEFDKSVLEQHKALLARMAGHVLFRSAPHFHAKMLLTDPDTAPAGMLLTANLTKEALTRNEELAVELTRQEVVEALALMAWAMWESAEHELVDNKGSFRAVQPMQCIAHPPAGSGIFATTAQTNDLRQQALAVIASAKTRLIVSSFGWDADHEVVQRICAQAQAGVDVTVLARIRPASMPALIKLAQAGARVLGFRWLHAKAIWADSGRALVMSANLQVHGLDQGFELGVALRDARANELRQRLDAWTGAAVWRLHPATTLGSLLGTVKIWRNQKLEDGEISEVADVQLATVVAKSADQLAATAQDLPTPPTNGTLPKLAHQLRCTRSIEAPKLTAKAKEVHRPSPQKGQSTLPQVVAAPYAPPVFREANGRIVVAIRLPSELPAAREVQNEVGAAAIVVAQGSTP
jgi:cardiolipin synthase A/B